MKPGAAIAFRLKNPETTSPQNGKEAFRTYGKICFRHECLPVTNRWQLLATDPEISGSQTFALFDDKFNWVLESFYLDRNIFDSVDKKIARLRLPANVVQRIQINSEQIAIDRKENRRILHLFSTDHSWATQWTPPLYSMIVSQFGSIREPPDGNPYAHSGLDLRASTGTPVRASSDGVVVAASHQVLSGNTIVIDHGYGLLSRYLHLSEFKVKTGDAVKGKQLIGLSGATGRVEGPHLHWEIRVRGKAVDPLSTARLLEHLADSE